MPRPMPGGGPPIPAQTARQLQTSTRESMHRGLVRAQTRGRHASARRALHARRRRHPPAHHACGSMPVSTGPLRLAKSCLQFQVAISSCSTWRTLHARRWPARSTGRHARRHSPAHTRRRAHPCAPAIVTKILGSSDSRLMRGIKSAGKVKSRYVRDSCSITRRRRRHSRRSTGRGASAHHRGRGAAAYGGGGHDARAGTTDTTRRASQTWRNGTLEFSREEARKPKLTTLKATICFSIVV